MTPQIIAHRGASYLAPENTLTAFKKAMEIGADGVEMDVQQTIDAGLVIHHDYMIDLHTDISGKIYDMTMGDLKELDFGSWKDAIYQDEKIATLQEAMELCKQMPGCTVHLELKSTMDNDPDFVPRVLEVLRQTEIVDQVILVPSTTRCCGRQSSCCPNCGWVHWYTASWKACCCRRPSSGRIWD